MPPSTQNARRQTNCARPGIAAMVSPITSSPAFSREYARTSRATPCTCPILNPTAIMRMPAPITPPSTHGSTQQSAGARAESIGTFACGRLHQGVGSGELGQERSHLVGWSFPDQKIKNDTDGLLCGRSVNAEIGDETFDQLVHSPSTPALAAGCFDNVQFPKRDKFSNGNPDHLTYSDAAMSAKRCKRATLLRRGAAVEMAGPGHYKILMRLALGRDRRCRLRK